MFQNMLLRVFFQLILSQLPPHSPGVFVGPTLCKIAELCHGRPFVAIGSRLSRRWRNVSPPLPEEQGPADFALQGLGVEIPAAMGSGPTADRNDLLGTLVMTMTVMMISWDWIHPDGQFRDAADALRVGRCCRLRRRCVVGAPRRRRERTGSKRVPLISSK